MKKILLVLFSLAFFSQSFAQHNVDFKFKINYKHSFGWSKITVQEGTFTEGVPYTIPEYTMPADKVILQAAYNSIVGATFGIDAGPLNNDIRLDITLDGLDLTTGVYVPTFGESLFLFLTIDVYDPIDTTEAYSGNYWFNTGHPMMFKIPRQPNFDNFVTSLGLNPDDIAFQYIEETGFFPESIQTFITSEYTYFLADHLSQFGGVDGSVVNVDDARNTELPSVYALEQNYPNPFNPTTNISFSLPEVGYVSMKVYNTLGSEITTLISDNMSAGNHVVAFDATNLPSGIYFYTLNSNNVSITKKMMLIK